MSFDSLLNRRCTVEKSTDTLDAFGTQTRVWTVRFSNLKCRVVPATDAESREQSIRNKEAVKRLTTIFTHYKSSIIESDRILFDGVYYDIDLVRNPGSMNHHLEMDCEAIT